MSHINQIMQAIMELMDEHDGIAQINRNEMASRIGCAPSQINYVISSRFNQNHGFVVESRRGGGGYIRIQRVITENNPVNELIQLIGDTVDEYSVRVILTNLLKVGVVNEYAVKMMFSALNDNTLKQCPAQVRDTVRANIFKTMLLNK